MTPPISYVTTRYRCPFCHRSWAKKRAAQDHIDYCRINPESKGVAW